MTNYFLHNVAINVQEDALFRKGMLSLNDVHQEKIDNENFFKHDSIWNLSSINQLYLNPNGDINVILKFIGSLASKDKHYNTDEEIDEEFPNSQNAFLGIDFTKINGISYERQVIDCESALRYRQPIQEKMTYLTFWEMREREFPFLEFSESIKEQIKELTNSTLFDKVISNLKEVNNYLAQHQLEYSSCAKIKNNASIRMSRDSEPTMQQYSDERMFITESGKLLFNYHIKVKDIRIYVAEKMKSNKLYVGYIGKHLRTANYPK